MIVLKRKGFVLNQNYPFKIAKIPLSSEDLINLSKYEDLFKGKFRGKRLNEFLAGRWCAHQAVREYDNSFDKIIGISKRGVPLWPEGFVGSISHSKGCAVATVLNSDKLLIGIDIEEIVSFRRVEIIEKTILNEKEREMISKCCTNSEKQFLSTLIFSAKESLYKALNVKSSIYIHYLEGIFCYFNKDRKNFEIQLSSEKKS